MQGTGKAARVLLAGLLAIGVLASKAPTAEAAGYLKFEGIDGEALDQDHDQWVDVISVDWGAQKPSVSAPGERLMQPEYGAGGPPSSGAGTLTITKAVDKASRGLRQKKKSRRRIKSVMVDLPGGAAGAGYVKYELTNVIVASYKVRQQGGKKIETIVLHFESASALPAPARLKLKPKRK